MPEYKNSDMRYVIVVSIIDEYRKETGDPPPDMMAVYDYLHEKHIEEAKEVKTLQTMFKE